MITEAYEEYSAYLCSLEAAMIRHFRAGLRDRAFHAAVRAEFPDCDLATYNDVADKAWRALAPAAEPESTTAVTTEDLHQAMIDVGRRVFRLEDVVTLLHHAAGNNAEVSAAVRILDYAVKDLIAANTKMRRNARRAVSGINDCDPF
jgi:hypothetical protein